MKMRRFELQEGGRGSIRAGGTHRTQDNTAQIFYRAHNAQFTVLNMLLVKHFKKHCQDGNNDCEMCGGCMRGEKKGEKRACMQGEKNRSRHKFCKSSTSLGSAARRTLKTNANA